MVRFGCFDKLTYTIHSISAHTCQEGIKCTKAKEHLRVYYPNIFTVHGWHNQDKHLFVRAVRVNSRLSESGESQFSFCSRRYTGIVISKDTKDKVNPGHILPFDTKLLNTEQAQYLPIFLPFDSLQLLVIRI